MAKKETLNENLIYEIKEMVQVVMDELHHLRLLRDEYEAHHAASVETMATQQRIIEEQRRIIDGMGQVRNPRGAGRKRKTDERTAAEIRGMREEKGATYREIAAAFGVSASLAHGICKGKE